MFNLRAQELRNAIEHMVRERVPKRTKNTHTRTPFHRFVGAKNRFLARSAHGLRDVCLVYMFKQRYD